MYQNYIFDFYGTLADIRTDEEKPYLWQKMSEIYGAMGAGYGPAELRQTFRRLEREEAERLGTQDAEPDLYGRGLPGLGGSFSMWGWRNAEND